MKTRLLFFMSLFTLNNIQYETRNHVTTKPTKKRECFTQNKGIILYDATSTYPTDLVSISPEAIKIHSAYLPGRQE
jgi:hypothetical protein